MGNFSKSYGITARFEGGYQANENDYGNYACDQLIGTKYGIAAITLQDWIGRCPTVSDMKNLSQETAKQIYYKKFWLNIGGDHIGDQSVANMIFDAYVNQTGYLKAILRDAFAMNGITHVPRIPFTQETIDYINIFQGKMGYKFHQDLKEARRVKYLEQANKMGSEEFLEGWMGRCFTGSNFKYLDCSVPPDSTAYLDESMNRLNRQSYGVDPIFLGISGISLIVVIVTIFIIFKKK